MRHMESPAGYLQGGKNSALSTSVGAGDKRDLLVEIHLQVLVAHEVDDVHLLDRTAVDAILLCRIAHLRRARG